MLAATGGSPAEARIDLAGLAPRDLGRALGEGAVPRYVPHQIFRWVYARNVSDFARMTDLSKTLRAELLKERFGFRFPAVSGRYPAADGTTRYVYRLDDGERTESVFIPGEPGQATLCLSSQVGCPLGCTFCVSGVAGVRRNLSTAEVVGQALAMLGEHPPLRRTNVVFMGMGEALLNFDAVTAAFAILADPAGPSIPLRRMTVSTAGHVPAIARFAGLAARPRLAVSLNAATDEVRSRIMPINRTWPLAQLLAACREFPLAPGERVTFEYVLLGGINDSPDDARRLASLVRAIACKVNLIPWNASPRLEFRSPSEEDVDRFAETLRRAHVRVTVRRRRGADAGAACGQLALERADQAEPRESA